MIRRDINADDLELPPKYEKVNMGEEELKERYKNMLFEPGEAIGVVAAQSVSEPATQMTMETYHSAGGAKVSITQGLPRLIEIVNARRNPDTPVMNVYLKEGYRNKEDARKVAAKIKEVVFDDVVSEDTLDLRNLELEFVIDESMLEQFEMDMDDVVSEAESKLSKVDVERDGNVISIQPTAEEYDLTDLQDMKTSLEEHRLNGFKGVEDVVILEEDGEWRVQTAGINLRKTLRLEEVDESRTVCNDLYEFYKVFGIEGTRNLILSELENTMEDQGMSVDVRWLMLISDTMTKEGEVQGATRYGLCGDKNSVLARAAFEETSKHVTGAAIKGETDPLNSVVENIILGQVIPIGTGQVDLKARAAKAPESVLEKRKEKREEIRKEKEEKLEDMGESEESDGEGFDYEEIVDQNISEIKSFVEENGVDFEKLLDAEEAKKDRKTLKSWIEERIGEQNNEMER